MCVTKANILASAFNGTLFFINIGAKGLIKLNKNPILQCTIPITFCITKKGEDNPSVNHIIRIYCALSKMCDSVVLFEYIFYISAVCKISFT